MRKSFFLFWAFAIVAMLVLPGCVSEPNEAGQDISVVASGHIFLQGSQPEFVNLAPGLNDGQADTGNGPRRMRPGQEPNPLQKVSVEYDWQEPVKTGEIELFWWDREGTVKLPQTYTLSQWNGTGFVPVSNPQGLGVVPGEYNKTTFDVVETTRLRLDFEFEDERWLGALRQALLEWKVIQAPGAKNLTPVLSTNGDRHVMLGAQTYLTGSVRSVTPCQKMLWSKVSGPGEVTFTNGDQLNVTAGFSTPGDYVLAFTVEKGGRKTSSELLVKVTQPPMEDMLNVVYTKHYSIDNPLWNDRAKALIVNWIPWCIAQCENSSLPTGGLDNFIEAAKALKGQSHGSHKGYVFANAWVHQTVESMCIALMVDAKGDPEIIAAQNNMRKTLEKWIPIILAAQESDGYLQTAYTLSDRERWPKRWNPDNRSDHEGYVAGYFIESAINHYTLTNGTDLRLYNAAKKLADCWADNIGSDPGQIVWWDGHQEMEQALVRFGRFVNDMEGNGKGERYITLAKFLLDSRDGGSEYDQSHVLPREQYEAVGHAVRAVYSYSAMSDIAAETRDPDYQSAVMSLWDNMVNKKYYVTGGIGSGETSEGFGPNYSLRNGAYCESCSSCGMIFFQNKLNLAYHDGRYADLLEETMYNALLGSYSMDGKTFYYQNPLNTSAERHPWHGCPCCVGNIPRTLLMIPTWTYATSPQGIYVNMFVGSTINIEKAVGTDVQMVQKTDYPWDGKVSVTVNPKEEKEFTLFVRVPGYKTSELYTRTPELKGLLSLSVNGQVVEPVIQKGYAEIKRTWKMGDKVEFELPMQIQKITADERIEANRGKVALRYGPMIYSFEEVDNGNEINEGSLGTGELKAEWDPGFFGGMLLIKGTWADGKPLTAIPNYARMNRNEPRDPQIRTTRSNVWVNK